VAGGEPQVTPLAEPLVVTAANERACVGLVALTVTLSLVVPNVQLATGPTET
jgi:hypothetical protein